MVSRQLIGRSVLSLGPPLLHMTGQTNRFIVRCRGPMKTLKLRVKRMRWWNIAKTLEMPMSTGIDAWNECSAPQKAAKVNGAKTTL